MKGVETEPESTMEGTPIGRGIGIGTLFLLPSLQKGGDSDKEPHENVALEIKRYKEAVKASVDEIKALQKQLKKERADDAVAILESHLELLHDPILTSQIEEEIRKSRTKGLSALQTVFSDYEKQFQSLNDPFFRERFRDIQDVSERVMRHLGKKMRQRLENLPSGVVLFAHDLTPSEVASIPPGSVKAIVTEKGGATSHTAIVAKAKGIPYVSHLTLHPKKWQQGDQVIVDGNTGKVITSPLKETLEHYFAEAAKVENEKKMQSSTFTPPKTKDGVTIYLSINVDSVDDLPNTPAPCGLFRTEFLFNEDQELPTEEEQFAIYKEILQRFGDKPVVIRAFDLGGDKGAILKEHHTEENPALGLRAIRLLLQELPIFKKQLRALLRAAAFGKLKFLLPMVTSLEEVYRTKAIIKELKTELMIEGLPSGEFIGLGCMIEVPSAALIIDSLATESDFFSVGTNDLLQFLLAVDRNKLQVVPGASHFHPAMIRMLKTIVDEAGKAGIPLSVCGEIASDPKTVPLLIGLGIRELSVSWHQLSNISAIISNVSVSEVKAKVEESLHLATTHAIESLW